MENSKEQLVSKLNSDLQFLAHHSHEELGKIVYDAMLHMQNTPGGTIEQALGYISHMTDTITVEMHENRYDYELPF